MAFEFKLPDIGEGIHEGEIVRWLVKEGDRVEEDQPLVEVMTDKATVELPSPVAGTVLEIKAKEGEVVKVGSVLVVIGEASEAPKRDGREREAAAVAAPAAPTPEKPERERAVEAAPAPAPRRPRHRRGRPALRREAEGGRRRPAAHAYARGPRAAQARRESGSAAPAPHARPAAL